MKFRENVKLAEYTTFRIGGPAKYFCAAKNKKDLIEAVFFAKKIKLPFFILGNGSNLLVSDKGYEGLVIKTGRPLSLYISKGLEWAAGIPGTIEGAVRGNAGAFGGEMKDSVKEVETFDAKSQKVKIFQNKDCQFSYRSSIFKKNSNLIILSVKIKSKKSNPQKIKEYLKYRSIHHPKQPSAGSVFKNLKNIRARDLIEEAGLKGRTIGGAQISEQHANFIINLGGAKAKDVLGLIDLAKKEVKNKFGIKLEEEIKLLGKF